MPWAKVLSEWKAILNNYARDVPPSEAAAFAVMLRKVADRLTGRRGKWQSGLSD